MALKGGSITKKNSQDYTIGPIAGEFGGTERPNPADTLRTGSVPVRTLPQTTLSRPLERPVRLYRREDPKASPEMEYEPLPEGVDPHSGSYGVDKNKYGKAPKEQEYTANGGLIYGT